MMAMRIDGIDELQTDIARMAAILDANGIRTNQILQEAARPVEAQMIANASSDPAPRSGQLRSAISTSNVHSRARGGKRITIGVHRKDWSDDDYYPAYVEYGHGGPAPAPPHPYVRPAFDATEDEAYGIIRNGLRDAINNL